MQVNDLGYWTKEVAANVARQGFLTGRYQDNALHPESYIDISAKSTQLGTPIGDKFIVFTLPNSTDLANIDLTLTQKSVGELSGLVLEDPIITISRDKEIIRTKVNGLDGDIVEVVSNGTYDINIIGVFASDNFWKYDSDNIKILEDAFAYKQALEVISPYLNDIFKIYNVVLVNHKIAQSTEFTNVTAYEINCIAILDIDIFTLDKS